MDQLLKGIACFTLLMNIANCAGQSSGDDAIRSGKVWNDEGLRRAVDGLSS